MIAMYFKQQPSPERILSSPAGPYLEGLVTELARQGFGRWKLRGRVLGAVHFSLWTAMQGLDLEQLHEDALPAFRAHLSLCHCPGWLQRGHHADACVSAGARSFLERLRQLSVLKSPAPMPPAPVEPPLVPQFNEWMRQQRGVKDKTLRPYDQVVGDLLHSLGEAPSEYTAQSLRNFVLKRTAGMSRSQGKLITTAARNFLRFLIAQGECRSGLDGAIPNLAIWRKAALPRYLPPAKVDQIIAACDRGTAVGLRDRAALLLLARLGLRAGDIRALRLCDIDWRQASVRVAGKSHTETRLPLTQEVGDALEEYLDVGRPPAATDSVFVRMAAPWRQLGSSSVSGLVARAISRAGVESPFRGAHILRHSAATAMLREGATLDQVGAVLRHRSLDTTAIYAKVDVNRLREIALPWPEVMPC